MILIAIIKRVVDRFGLLENLRQTKFYLDLAVFLKKEHRILLFKEKTFYRQLVKKHDLVFDIGSNIGSKTYLFHEIGCKVISVEPDSTAFITLKKRLGKLKNIILLNIGIGESKSIQELFKLNSSTLSTFDKQDLSFTVNDPRFNSNADILESEIIQMDTLDNLIYKYGLPKFVKISTVGYELNVLKGLNNPVKFLSITCNLPYHAEKTMDCIHLIDKLGNYEYNFFKSHLVNGFHSADWMNSIEIRGHINQLLAASNCHYIEIFARIKEY